MTTKSEKKDERFIVCELVQTCNECPAQWEATLDDGRMLYIRYRWGYLKIEISESPTSDVMDAVNGKEVYGEKLGDDYDGYLEQDELVKLTSDIIQYPCMN